MWDRHEWRLARQSFKDQRRASRQAYRDTRRAYRHNYYRRSPFGGLLILILVILIVSHLAYLIPLVILAGCFYVGSRIYRSNMLGSSGSRYLGSNSNYQQPNQYYQPSQQPQQSDQANQYYQPSVRSEPSTPTPSYEPYNQGYQVAPQNDYQQGAQPYQSNPYESATTQYEEPQAQYPEEMPPMA